MAVEVARLQVEWVQGSVLVCEWGRHLPCDLTSILPITSRIGHSKFGVSIQEALTAHYSDDTIYTILQRHPDTMDSWIADIMCCNDRDTQPVDRAAM